AATRRAVCGVDAGQMPVRLNLYKKHGVRSRVAVSSYICGIVTAVTVMTITINPVDYAIL
ncbi:MAG: hypothetical protein SPI92_03865, partial [Alloprevotella sp.]|nr:hypothetical protein [Alloprevotella sp.]